MKRLMTAFPLLCALLALSPRANAQNNTNGGESFCPGDCVPMGQICSDRWPGNGAVYNVDPMVPSTCPATCTPTQAQCSHMLVTCPAPAAGSNQPCTDGPAAARTNPGPRHTPGDRVRPPVDDVCEAGAESDPDHPGTCRCVEGADFGPSFVGIPTRHHGRWRMEMADRSGARHISCYIDPEQVQQPPPPPLPSNNGNNGLNRDDVNRMIQEHQTPGLTRQQAEEIVRGGVDDANRRLTAVESRPQVMFGLHAALSMLHVSLPGEDAFTLMNPALGGSLRINWPTGPNLSFELFGQVGWTNTGHVCDAVTFEGGLRAGWAIGDSRIVTPHVGWTGWLAHVPCHPPTGGDQVADGVAFATGPTVGVTVRLWDGLHIGAEFRWTPISRFTETWSRDFNGVAPVGGNIWVGYRFFGP